MKHSNNQSGSLLIELVVGIMVVAIAFGVFMIIHAELRVKAVTVEATFRATNLANSIMGIIRSHDFDENESPPWSASLGPEEGSSANFDDVDDYTGYNYPAILAGFTGYNASSQVFYVNPSVSWLTNAGTVNSYKRIIVTVNHEALKSPIVLSSLVSTHGKEAPPPTPPPGPCACEGKMVNFTVQYIGIGGVNINVYTKSDHSILITSFTNVQTDDNLMVDGSGLSQGKFESKTYIEVVGSGDTEIHTSCSQEILGNTYGPFTVISHTDNEGNYCEVSDVFITPPPPPPPPGSSCECEHGMVTLIVQYLGTSGVNINVYSKSDHSVLITSFSNVQTGDNLSVDGSGLSKGKFESKTYFEEVGSGDTEIHTSCSQEIFHNFYGNFYIISHVDNEGNICI